MVGYQVDDDSKSFHKKWVEITISIHEQKLVGFGVPGIVLGLLNFLLLQGNPQFFGDETRARLHLGSLCSFLDSRLLLEISWIRKRENMNSSTLCVETPSRVCLPPPPQEVVEEEVMRLMGRWGASLKSCLFALSFHVSQAVNLVTHPVSAKG